MIKLNNLRFKNFRIFRLPRFLTQIKPLNLGLPENVEVAKQEIEQHISARTGAGFIDRDLDFAANGTDVGDDGEIEEPM